MSDPFKNTVTPPISVRAVKLTLRLVPICTKVGQKIQITHFTATEAAHARRRFVQNSAAIVRIQRQITQKRPTPATGRGVFNSKLMLVYARFAQTNF
jgi:hypothetical protein